jgi:hypothetical protein
MELDLELDPKEPIVTDDNMDGVREGGERRPVGGGDNCVKIPRSYKAPRFDWLAKLSSSSPSSTISSGMIIEELLSRCNDRGGEMARGERRGGCGETSRISITDAFRFDVVEAMEMERGAALPPSDDERPRVS